MFWTATLARHTECFFEGHAIIQNEIHKYALYTPGYSSLASFKFTQHDTDSSNATF